MPRSEGLTRTERFLGRLAQRSFLTLWAHANVYRDVAKELCDLLVVCHNVVIIFSDKEVAFQEDKPIEIAWQRWYNRAILKSVPQLKRAANWIKSHSDRIFRDAQCNEPLSLFERVDEPLEIHLVAVANGASRSCIKHFGGGSGSLLVSPSDPNANPEPFCVGNPGVPGMFVHVFDEAHLHIILQELDTIRDFSDYLTARQRLVLNDNLFLAAGEEDLLAVYLKDVNEKGEHDFVWETGVPLKPGEKIVVPEGVYKNYRKAPAYRRKKKADQQSYLWDRLIDKFARNLLGGTLSPVPGGIGQDGRDGGAELGLRYMALERRVLRRSHASAMLGAFDNLEKQKGNRYFRAMIPEGAEQGNTGFCVLLVKREIAPEGTSFDEYRQFRAANLGAYTENLLERNRHLKRVIGIATEGSRRGPMSEDLIYHEPPDWTEEAIKSARERGEGFQIFTGGMRQSRSSTLEYPTSDTGLRGQYAPIPYRFIEKRDGPSASHLGGNRHQRRAAAAKKRKTFT